MELLFNLVVFALFAVLWAAFAYTLVGNRGGLDAAWGRLRGLPLVVQALVAVLLLPLVIGLWVWRAGWPVAMRVAVISALAIWNLYVFLPTTALAR